MKKNKEDMINTLGQNLYSITEVSSLLGIRRETLSEYAKRVKIEGRRINRVKYFTEEEIKTILRLK